MHPSCGPPSATVNRPMMRIVGQLRCRLSSAGQGSCVSCYASRVPPCPSGAVDRIGAPIKVLPRTQSLFRSARAFQQRPKVCRPLGIPSNVELAQNHLRNMCRDYYRAPSCRGSRSRRTRRRGKELPPVGGEPQIERALASLSSVSSSRVASTAAAGTRTKRTC